jgi:hypothetical protein
MPGIGWAAGLPGCCKVRNTGLLGTEYRAVSTGYRAASLLLGTGYRAPRLLLVQDTGCRVKDKWLPGCCQVQDTRLPGTLQYSLLGTGYRAARYPTGFRAARYGILLSVTG